jgi:uncharacterized metal-binding protein YceD (DUF177 family)
MRKLMVSRLGIALMAVTLASTAQALTCTVTSDTLGPIGVGDEIDLEPFLRDEVLLDLPMGPACPDGCREVVTTPESDLNTGSPGDDAESGSPFAVLRELFEPGD